MKLKYFVGDAIRLIPSLNEKWDIVFIDADKLNYVNYYNLVFDSVEKGGYIIADNVLWSGKVVDSSKMHIIFSFWYLLSKKLANFTRCASPQLKVSLLFPRRL